jgi:hypothetical protein
LIVFLIFGMFCGVFWQNGRAEQFKNNCGGPGSRVELLEKTTRNNPLIKSRPPGPVCLGDPRKRSERDGDSLIEGDYRINVLICQGSGIHEFTLIDTNGEVGCHCEERSNLLAMGDCFGKNVLAMTCAAGGLLREERPRNDMCGRGIASGRTPSQ